MPRYTSTSVLSARALNRALLARQMLLRRAPRSPVSAIEHLVGMQAQVPATPYVGLWSRLEGFRPADLAELIIARRVVRTPLLRATIHLVSARDCVALHPLVRPMMKRGLLSTFGRSLEGLSLERIRASGRRLLERQPMSGAELGKLLRQQWPDRDARSLAYAVQYLEPLVQVPPRGIWGATGPARWTTVDAWLDSRNRGPDEAPERVLDETVRRYLAAFGPATVADMRAWSGITGLRDAVDRLRPRLRTFRDERGVELFDLARAPCPAPDVVAPPRFLPDYDNTLLSHADRTRIVPARHKAAVGIGRPTLLVDGFVAATWRIVRGARSATLVIEPFDALSRAQRAAVTAEGRELLSFLAAGAPARDVRFQ